MQTRWMTKSLLVTLLLTLWLAGSVGVFAQQHVSNPFVGATQYVNPDYAKEVQALMATTSDPVLKAQMNTVTTYSTGIWMDRIAAISGSATRLSLQAQLDNAVLVQQAAGKPVVVPIVIYDLPDRDCAARASNGELSIDANPPTQPLDGLTTYETQYIDVISGILSNSKYVNLRFVLIIEPDSLPNLITNTGKSFTIQNCVLAQSSGVYVKGIQHAINVFHLIPNAYLYLDIGHSAWLGWPDNAQLAVTGANSFTTVVQGTTAGLGSIDGFIDNTANYTPTKEPFIDANATFNGNKLISANFYSFNATVDEAGYATELQTMFRNAGWPVTSTNFITDTSRNGWGGPNRPTAASTSTDINTFVDASRIDRRNHRGQWCNQSGAGLGVPPLAAPPDFPQFQAYVWIKPPGESDGTYPGSANQNGAAHADPNCDPAQTNPLAGNTLTGSIANSPPAGNFFADEFIQNIQNAFPPVPSDTTPTFSIFGSGLSVMQAATGTTSITVLPVNNFAGTVALSVSGLPTGVTASFNPTSIANGSGSSILTFTVAANAPVPAAPVPITVTGTSGSITKSTTINLTIVGRPDFSVTAVTTSVTLTPGSNPTATINIASLFGFTGTVSVSASNLPAGVSANFSPSSVNGSGTVVVNFNGQSNTPAGTTNISIVGTSGSLTHSATIAFTVVNGADFSLAASNPAAVTPGGTTTSTVTVTPLSGFNGSVSLSTGVLPSGVTASFNPASTTGTSTLTFTASATATIGAATVTINGVSGSLSHSTTVTLIVSSGADFSLSGTNATVVRGGTGTSTVTVTAIGGFTGSVSLSTGTLPSGVTASFNPASTTGTSTLTFTASSTATVGSATVTITGVSGTLMHSTTITLVVSAAADFSLSGTNATVVQGSTGTSTVTVTPSGGFTGSVSLSTGTLPSGVTASFNPASTTGTSTLTFTASSTATAGSSTVTITGTSGTLSHSTTITLTVNPSGANFSLSANPASVSVGQGSSATSVITITPTGGFASGVTFSAAGQPSGVTVGFNPNPATTSSTVTFTASSTASVGTSTVTITGTSGTLSHSVTIALTVTGQGGVVTLTPVINANGPWFDDEGVRVNNTAALTALSITITVQNTGGMNFNGQYNTVGGQITQSHSNTATTLTYQFNLAAGQTLSPGSYLFDAQMGGTGTAHPTTGDTFTVTYTSGGTTATQTGHF